MEEEEFLNLEEAIEEEDDEDSDEDEIKKIKIGDMYILEVEEKFQPVYDKFINGVDPNPSVILNEKSVDYNELFSYLGNRITTNMYESAESGGGGAVLRSGDQEVIPVELKTIEAGIKKVKYLTPGNVTMDSPIPFEGMTSDEYEKFRMWKVLNPGMAKFYMDTM
ncbi:hypothetical protein HQ529_01280 [Candidatus Woesearchaeota archaeon]|nr:hypothetical protein [Candidatus Woesearchaeota archaeon]